MPVRWARRVRRATGVFALLAAVWMVLQYDSRWVPRRMGTVPDMPPGTWQVVDTWASDIVVGNHVWIDTPHGELLSRVSAVGPDEALGLGPDELRIEHPNQVSGWGDSQLFGALPKSAVNGVVVAAFAPDEDDGR